MVSKIAGIIQQFNLPVSCGGRLQAGDVARRWPNAGPASQTLCQHWAVAWPMCGCEPGARSLHVGEVMVIWLHSAASRKQLTAISGSARDKGQDNLLHAR